GRHRRVLAHGSEGKVRDEAACAQEVTPPPGPEAGRRSVTIRGRLSGGDRPHGAMLRPRWRPAGPVQPLQCRNLIAGAYNETAQVLLESEQTGDALTLRLSGGWRIDNIERI